MNKLHKIQLPTLGKLFSALLMTALLGFTLLGSPGWSASEGKAPAAPVAKQETSAADQGKVLQQACDLLKSTKQLTFKAEVTDDRVYTGGKKLQFAFDLEAYVARPDKLRINAANDLENKQFFYDGKTITLYDMPKNAYAVMAAPATIDEALGPGPQRVWPDGGAGRPEPW